MNALIRKILATKRMVRKRIQAAKMVFIVIGTSILLTSTIQAKVTYDALFRTEMIMIKVLENEASATQRNNAFIVGNFDNLYSDEAFLHRMSEWTHLTIAPGSCRIDEPENFMAWTPPSKYKFEYAVSICMGIDNKRYTIIKINQDGICYDDLDGKLLIRHLHTGIFRDGVRAGTNGVVFYITVKENFYRAEGVMAELNRHVPFDMSSKIHEYATGEKTAIGLDPQYKVHPVVTTVFSETPNLIINGDFENWSGGTSSAPDWWEFEGSGSVERDETVYAAKLTGRMGCCRLESRIDNSIKNIDYWRSKTLTFGCWVYATKANTTRLQIYDSKGLSSSSYHTGNSTWQWLMVKCTVNPAATSLSVFLCNESDTSSWFIGPMCAEPTNLSTNLFPNGGFERWSSGTSSAPDGWAFGGVGAVKQVKIGTYAAKLTGTTGCSLQYRIDNSLKSIAYWKNKTLTFGCWVYSTTANTTRLQIRAGINGPSSSSYHTGNSTWQWLTVTCTIDPVADSACVCLSNEGDASSKFIGPMCAEQSLASINRQALEHPNSAAVADSNSLPNQTPSNTMPPEEDAYLNTIMSFFMKNHTIEMTREALILLGCSAESIRKMLGDKTSPVAVATALKASAPTLEQPRPDAVVHKTPHGSTSISLAAAAATVSTNAHTPTKQAYSISKWYRLKSEVALDGRITVNGPASTNDYIFDLPLITFKKGECIAMRGTLKNGTLGFGLLSSDRKRWIVPPQNTSANGDFVLSLTPPEAGSYIPMVVDRSSSKDKTIECEVADISVCGTASVSPATAATVSTNAHTPTKQAYSISKWYRLKSEAALDGRITVKGPASTNDYIFDLPLRTFKKGECIAMRGTLKSGTLGFGLLSSDRKRWIVTPQNTSANGDFVLSLTPPEAGSYIPMVVDRSSPKDKTIECEVADISVY